MKKVIHTPENPIFFSAVASQCGEVVRKLLREVSDKNANCTAYIDGDAIIIKKVSERERWIRHYLDVFESSGGTYEIQGNFTIISLPYRRLQGASLCGRKDSFDRDVGIAVATARAFGAEIPDYI